MKIKMPTDIKKYIAKKVIIRVLWLVLLIALSICANVYLWEIFAAKSRTYIHIVFIVVSALLPFVISGIPLKLIDNSWSGTVTNIEIKEETGTVSNGTTNVFPYIKHVIVLTLKKDNGSFLKVRIKEYGTRNHPGIPVPSEGNIHHHMNDYSIGDIVYHFYGLSEYFVLSLDPTKPVNCVICGNQTPAESGKCWNCGYSLITVDRKKDSK